MHHIICHIKQFSSTLFFCWHHSVQPKFYGNVTKNLNSNLLGLDRLLFFFYFSNVACTFFHDLLQHLNLILTFVMIGLYYFSNSKIDFEKFFRRVLHFWLKAKKVALPAFDSANLFFSLSFAKYLQSIYFRFCSKIKIWCIILFKIFHFIRK